MKKLEIEKLLNEGIENKNQLHIVREKIDCNPIECIPLSMKQKLLLIQYLYDFQPDGYMIIRLRDITSLRYREPEKYMEFILKEEGILDQIKQPLPIDLNDWESFFNGFKMSEKNIIIESENLVDGEFYIGKITKVYKESLLLLCFNEIGEWDEKPIKILFKDITSVKFNDRYTTIISKYLK